MFGIVLLLLPNVAQVSNKETLMRSLTIERGRTFYIGDYVAVEKNPGVFKVRGNNRDFTIREIGPHRWKVNGKSLNALHKSHYPRLTIQAEDLAGAIADAENRLFPQTGLSQGAHLELAEVFARWIKTKTVNAHTLMVYKDGVKRFLDWVQPRGHKQWADLTRGVLQEYLASLKEYRTNYRKNLWKPIRAASLWASLEWPDTFRDIAARIQITDIGPQYPDDKVSLSLPEVAELCWSLRMSEEGRRILPGIALQGLVGLRVTEAFRLRWDSIDLNGGIVTVEGNVKGRTSVRRVPIPRLVLLILNETERVGDRVLAPYCEFNNYGKAVGKWLKVWKRDLRLEPKGLRRTLESEAASRGWEGYAFNRYLGRAPGSIAERHYIAVGGKLVDLLREQVTSRIDAVLAPYLANWTRQTTKVIQLRAL